MNIERKENYQILTPDEGMWLFNEGQSIFSDRVFTPLTADISVWRDVTEEFKKQWEEEHRPQNDV